MVTQLRFSDFCMRKFHFQDFWHGAIQNGLKDARLKVVDVQVCGDTAYEIGKFSLTATSKDQDPKVLLGKYVVVWQRQADRTWKLHVDIWNSVPSQ